MVFVNNSELSGRWSTEEGQRFRDIIITALKCGTELPDEFLENLIYEVRQRKYFDFRGIELSEMTINNFSDVVMTFEKAKLINVNVCKSNMFAGDWEQAELKGVVFRECLLSALHSPHVHLNKCHFEKSHVNSSAFDNSIMSDVVFESSDLTGTSFRGVEFKNTKFVNCDLDGVNFDGSVGKPEII